MDNHYDLVIAGGSIAGAALGFAAQRAGARVLIVEPEPAFRDRVRGETLHPWGVAEAQRLGLMEVLTRAPARAVEYWDTYIAGQRVMRRELARTTPAHLTGYNVHHPELQTALLQAACDVGVEVRADAKVVRIEPGTPASIEIAQADDRMRVTAQLAVIADGRRSPLRTQLDIQMTGAPMPMLTSGVLLEGVRCEDEAIGMFSPRDFGALVLVLRLPRDRARLYFIDRAETAPRSQQRRGYSGAAQLPALLQRCVAAGVSEHWLAQAHAVGPLATFETTCWSLCDQELPHGVVLIGDAAGNVDPVFGCGQSLALRDVRTLIEHWRECHEDWQLAAARYIRERSDYHAALLRTEAWLTRILFTPSPEGDALRAAALPRLEQLGIDLVGAGPDSPTDHATEAKLFASF